MEPLELSPVPKEHDVDPLPRNQGNETSSIHVARPLQKSIPVLQPNTRELTGARDLLRSWAKLLVISVLVWEIEALLVVTSRIRLDDILSGKHRPLWKMFEAATLNFQVAAILIPFVVWLGVVGDFGKGRRVRSALIHIAGYMAFVAAHAVLRAHVLPTHNLLGAQVEPRQMSWVFFLAFLNDDVFVYGPTVILTILYRYYRQLRERELADERTRAELALAQLQILKMQLQPHFLFNTLHAISTLTTRDPKRARKMISLLSQLLRIAIEYGATQEVPLKEEIDFASKYLEIEQVRFESLQVRYDIPSDVLDALVPNLLLQPIVENAVKHGVCMLESGGWVSIEAERREDDLILHVSDNGPGIATELDGGESGLGLRLTRARLQRLYGRRSSLHIETPASGGARISMSIPFHTAAVRPVVQ